MEKISWSVRSYVYLVLTSQVQARSSTVGNPASAVSAQQVFKSTFRPLINEDYLVSTDIERYEDLLEHALSKVDFSIGTGIYVVPSTLNLNIGKKVGYNNKILVGNADMKTGSNKDINKDHKKLPLTPTEPAKAEGASLKVDKPIKDHLAVQHEQIDNPKMLAGKHNDENLAITIFIVGAGLIAYHFW